MLFRKHQPFFGGSNKAVSGCGTLDLYPDCIYRVAPKDLKFGQFMKSVMDVDSVNLSWRMQDYNNL